MALIAAVVTDIDGTTSSLAVLRDVLGPYARRNLAVYVRAHRDSPEVQRQLFAARTLALQHSIDAALLATPGAPGYLVGGHGLTTWAHDVPGVKRHVEALEFLLACSLAG
jgi:ribulose-5-phosphate 4-epimerase/fuculose-1-phosphate aldolase